MEIPVIESTFKSLAIGDFFYFDIDLMTQQASEKWKDFGLMIKVAEGCAVPMKERILVSPETKVIKVKKENKFSLLGI